MKISYRWLREYVDTDLPPAELADRLTNAGIPVEGIAPLVEGLAGVVVGEIEAIERDLEESRPGHVNRLCRVALPDRKLSVICGAPNVAPGLRTALAPPGATLPGGRAISVATIRGTRSEGMLCSEKELGIGDDNAGILALPADAPLGTDLVTYLGLDDTIFEIEITPNRPDALSIVGVAREVAAVTGAPFRFPQVSAKESDVEASARAGVEIADGELCPRYAARLITGLTVKPSPPWLAQRLRAVGLRPINNVVDVTNYVMWELGQPLHAFDHATLRGGRIVVRRAQPGERITTLDGRDRALTPDMLAICDAERPVAIAGVMGGADTEVRAGTTTVLLESACFNGGSVRRTSRALGLSTDAAYRFERGSDIEGVIPAINRAALLMADLGGGAVARGVIDAYPAPRPHTRIALRMERVERVIGAAPPRAEVIRILQALGFAVDDSGAALQVVVPSFRRDILQEDDLVEEIVRIWGYDKIPLVLAPAGEITSVTRPADQMLADRAGGALTAAGLSECITYSFLDPARLKAMGWDDPARLVALLNPLSAERSVMRPSLVPGLLEVLATNVHRQRPDVRVFETGVTFAPHREGGGDRPAHEELWLGVALTGQRGARAWHAARERVDVYDAKGMAELVLTVAGAPGVTTQPWAAGDEPGYLEPGRAARLLLDGQEVARFGEVAHRLREVFDLPAPAFVAEVCLSALVTRTPAVPRYAALPRFPSVQRDLALLVGDEVTVAQVEAAIRGMAVPWLVEVALFDVYSGSQVGAGKRSLAWSLTYQAPDRTLTDAEVNEAHARVVDELARRFGAEVRGA
jgi:phenylalanyl-tRNA synthetase beta chain